MAVGARDRIAHDLLADRAQEGWWRLVVVRDLCQGGGHGGERWLARGRKRGDRYAIYVELYEVLDNWEELKAEFDEHGGALSGVAAPTKSPPPVMVAPNSQEAMHAEAYEKRSMRKTQTASRIVGSQSHNMNL